LVVKRLKIERKRITLLRRTSKTNLVTVAEDVNIIKTLIFLAIFFKGKT